MFARFVTLLPFAALAAVAAAAPNAPEARTAPTCSSGEVYCCDSQFSNTSNFERAPYSIIDVLLGVGINTGVQCSPITTIGAWSNGAQCTRQTACCSNFYQNGLVKIVCVPIAIPV